MRSASATFRRTMSRRRNFVNYADMTLSDGTILHLAPDDFRLGGNTIQDDIVDGDEFSVGTAIGKTVSIAIDNTSEFYSRFDFYNAVFVLYIGLELDDSTVEKIRIGIFTVITPATTGSVITMDAVDNMYKFDRPYANTVHFPATLQQIVVDACTQCGVTDNTGHFDRYRMEVDAEFTNDITYRQIISYVAQIAGVYAKIDEYGALKFAWYTDTVPEQYADGGNFRTVYKPDGSYLTGDDLDGGTFAYNDGDVFDGGLFTDPVAFHDLGFSKGVTVSTDNIVITGVRVKTGNGENEVDELIGTEDYCIVIDNNPLTVGNERTIAQALWAKLMFLTFRPFSLSYLQDPTIESGDWVIVTSAKGDTYFTFCTSVAFTTGSYMKISCNAQSPAKQGCTYSSSAAKAIIKSARETATQISTYDVAVQRMSQLAANAMGNYWQSITQDDGSMISYLSNKPLSINPDDGSIVFTLHSHVWKITGDGFFQCSNAPSTSETPGMWTGGIDANNNAVMTTVSAIGVNADWINTGTITIGGTSGNVDGKIIVKNASGTTIGQWDKTGLTVYDGTISGTDISGGTISGGYISGTDIDGGTIYGTEINGGTINGTEINGGTITGSTIRSDSSSTYYELEWNRITGYQDGWEVGFFDWWGGCDGHRSLGIGGDCLNIWTDYLYVGDSGGSVYRGETQDVTINGITLSFHKGLFTWTNA